jgi:hypothetical protein
MKGSIRFVHQRQKDLKQWLPSFLRRLKKMSVLIDYFPMDSISIVFLISPASGAFGMSSRYF